MKLMEYVLLIVVIILAAFFLYTPNSNSSDSLMHCTYDNFVSFNYPAYWNVTSTGLNKSFMIKFRGKMIDNSMPLLFYNKGGCTPSSQGMTLNQYIKWMYPSENWEETMIQGNESYITKKEGNGKVDIRLSYLVNGYYCELFGECNESDETEFEKDMYTIANSTTLKT